VCGIAGIFAFGAAAAPADATEVRRMREAMAARGPDDAGEWADPDGRIVLAHRRLAIIDLDARAAQPMRDPETGNVVVFNGEIYNYRALRRELEATGEALRTESDTEVLLHLYRRHGEGVVDRLRGMFAFALWDARRKRLVLARDPFGIKPLYIADDGKTLRFASQVRALVAGGAVSAEPSAAAMAGFFLWGHVPEPWTWAAAVRALPAGSTLTVPLGGPVPSPKQYFHVRDEILHAETLSPTMTDPAAAAVDALGDSVRHHLVADVPVGVFLSAGRDSTLIAALAARESAEPLRTLTLAFAEYRGSHWDEVPIAEEVARTIASHHRTERIAREDFERERERLVAAMDQPSIDGVNTYFVSRAAAAAGLKVALSGLGGDELFGGYASFRQVPNLARALRHVDLAPWFGRAVRRLTGPLARRLRRPKAAGLIEYGTSLPRAFLLRRALYMPWELPRVMDPALARAGLEELAIEDDLGAKIAGIRNPAAAVMALEMSCYMRNQLLRDADWAGMAHSLEIRVPLVDVELFRRWLPVAMRHVPFDRQRLLEVADPRIARTVGTRPKTGFSVPLQRWLQSSSPSTDADPGLRPWSRLVAQRFAPQIRPLRPLVLLTDAYGGVGGIAKFNRDVLEALDAMPECRAIDALPRLVQREPEPLPAKVRYRFEAAKGKLVYVREVLRAAMHGETYDLVICGHLNLLPLAWLVSAIRRRPLVLFVFGIEGWQRHRSLLVQILLGRVDRIAAISRYSADRFTSWSGYPKQRLSIVPCSVDLAAFTPRPRNESLVSRLGIGGRRVLLTVGRLASSEQYKGFDEVLDVLPEIARELPEVVYVIVGDGDDRARLERKAYEMGVAERVVFAGYVSEEEKKDLYSLADVYVMPSRGEGFGIVFLEAMAMGLPVIGSLVDGSRDPLLDGRLGQLVDPDDRAALIMAIRSAFQQPRSRPAGLDYFGVDAFRGRIAELVHDVSLQGEA
jgi:asparagine synthase (glutamine-hydrolysing)